MGHVPAIADVTAQARQVAQVPRATAFGKDAYPGLDAKAAALLHSVARNRALIDCDKRLALAALIAFCGRSGRRLTLTNDEAYDLVMSVASGKLNSADDIAGVLGPPPDPAARPASGGGPPAGSPARDGFLFPAVREARCGPHWAGRRESGGRDERAVQGQDQRGHPGFRSGLVAV